VVMASLSFYAAYIAFLPKRVVFDGYYLYLYQNKRLKWNIFFENVIEIGSGIHMDKLVRVNKIYIIFFHMGKEMTISITDNEFEIEELKIILRVLARYANNYGFEVVDENDWIK
jgi:hypothetical protein